MCLAVPGQLLSVTGEDPLFRRGRVAFGPLVKEISLACLPEVKVGQYVLVHAGIAISAIDAEEAQRVLALLESLEEDEP
ncbi:MAG: HypC/HybG/HupF family hydrogenase formation chaperone [Nevskia sp.]|nr:HypC/HybG/HupF family hydrogenase formation chaperone [Nevskia sp.]